MGNNFSKQVASKAAWALRELGTKVCVMEVCGTTDCEVARDTLWVWHTREHGNKPPGVSQAWLLPPHPGAVSGSWAFHRSPAG